MSTIVTRTLRSRTSLESELHPYQFRDQPSTGGLLGEKWTVTYNGGKDTDSRDRRKKKKIIILIFDSGFLFFSVFSLVTVIADFKYW